MPLGLVRIVGTLLEIARVVPVRRCDWMVVGDQTVAAKYGPNSPLKKASLTGFHATAKHIAAKAVSPSSETMRTI